MKSRRVVLVVGDDTCLDAGLRTGLERLGYGLVEVLGPQEGMAAFDNECPNLVLVDLRVNCSQALPFIAALRTKSANTPIVAIANPTTSECALAAIHAGAWDYVDVPTAPQWVLEHRLERNLELARLRTENKRSCDDSATAISCTASDDARREVVKRTETALLRSDQIHRTILEHAAEGFILTDQTGTVREWNAAMETLSGVRREEIIGQLIWDVQYRFLVPERRTPEVYEKIRTAVLGAVNTGVSRYGTAPLHGVMQRPDGQRRHIEQTVVLTRLENENCFGHFIRDVTERKIAEHALKASERRFATAFRASPTLLIIASLKSKLILEVNEAFERTTGYSRNELVGRTGMDVGLFADHDDIERMNRAFSIQMALHNAEAEIRKKNGDNIHGLFSMEVIEWDGEPCALCVGIDISERKEAEALAERHRGLLMEADRMASLGILISGVAHEINNPTNLVMINHGLLSKIMKDALTILDSYVEHTPDVRLVGLPYAQVRAELDALMGGIQIGATRIRDIVASLKDFVRSRPTQFRCLTNANDILQSALVIVRGLIRKSTDHFALELEPQLPHILANPQELEQVVINLLTNACEALPDSSRSLHVRTKAVDETNAVCIEVQDSGVGISAEDLPRIMDPFFTTKRERGGTGLGLSVSHGIMRGHGGHLLFETPPEGGTRVSMILPKAPERAAP